MAASTFNYALLRQWEFESGLPRERLCVDAESLPVPEPPAEAGRQPVRCPARAAGRCARPRCARAARLGRCGMTAAAADQETPARRQIRELAELAPPLTEQQRDLLRVLLDLTDGAVMSDVQERPAQASRPGQNPATRQGAGVIHSLPGVNRAVADKLRRLHTDHGYFTRAELEAELGLDTPPGQWECPGQFGSDGKWTPCCRMGAAA